MMGEAKYWRLVRTHKSVEKRREAAVNAIQKFEQSWAFNWENGRVENWLTDVTPMVHYSLKHKIQEFLIVLSQRVSQGVGSFDLESIFSINPGPEMA